MSRADGGCWRGLLRGQDSRQKKADESNQQNRRAAAAMALQTWHCLSIQLDSSNPTADYHTSLMTRIPRMAAHPRMAWYSRCFQ